MNNQPRIIAFTYNATNKETNLAKRCIGLLEKDFQLLNVPQYRIEKNVVDNQLIITFGMVLNKAVEQYIQEHNIKVIRHVTFPSLEKLTSTPQNTKTREKVFEEIQEVKKLVQKEIPNIVEVKVTEDDLPELNHQQILMLEKMTNSKTTFQVSRDGKLVEIGNEPDLPTEADQYITFKELYTIRQIMDILSVNEVKIVSSD